jgi:O-6-methylguanine DNA methyltransferase
MNRDRIDQMLVEYFQPAGVPAGLARDVIRQAGLAGREAEALLDRLTISATPRGVSLIRLGRQQRADSGAARRLVDRAREELHDYLIGQRAFFSVPADLSTAPEFQAKVLRAAGAIPFGQARPYAWVAQRIGHPRAVRAVGTALGKNPVPLIVPCHRVLKSDGGVGGYIFGTRVKQRLLGLERTTPVLEGCTSTHIVCRVGCSHLRRAKPENRVVFASVEDARSVGYRPCLMCRPARIA